MDLERGFQVEDPLVFVPWGVDEATLVGLLPVGLHEVTDGYYVIDCRSLGGLGHALGFHFRPRSGGTLRELELFRRSYPDLRESFDEFQEHLVQTFGPPDHEAPGDEGFPSFGWRRGAVTIRHYVFDRFGPEEHVRLVRS